MASKFRKSFTPSVLFAFLTYLESVLQEDGKTVTVFAHAFDKIGFKKYTLTFKVSKDVHRRLWALLYLFA